MIIYPVATPDALRIDHQQRGGSDLARYGADLPHGQLRIMVGREPAGRNGHMLLHVSVSVGNDPDSPPVRRPTDTEAGAAKAMWPNVKLVEEAYEAGAMIRHFWEAE